jgi:hypothetical protein
MSRQSLQAALATETAFLVAAERTGRVELVVGVRPDDAGAQLVDHLKIFRQAVCSGAPTGFSNAVFGRRPRRTARSTAWRA